MTSRPRTQRRRSHAPQFELGHLDVTTAARNVLKEAGVPLGDLLARHQRGDRGTVDEVDRKQNELAQRMPLRSIYALATLDRWHKSAARWVDVFELQTVWVITSADRSCTRVLLPREIFDEGEQQGE